MLHSSEALRRAGLQVDLMFHDDLGHWPSMPQVRRILTPWILLQRIAGIASRGVRYDVLEIHEPLAAPYCALRQKMALPPCALMCHGLEARHWEAQLERWRAVGERPGFKSRHAVPITLLPQSAYAIRRADQLIVLTEDDANYLKATFGVPPNRISRVDNGAPTMVRQERRQTMSVRLLFFGSWIDRKGIRELAEATNLLESSGEDFELTIAGTGSANDVLTNFSPDARRRITLRPRIQRPEIAALLYSHDAVVAPAWYEGMPLTVLEAAASGMALVLSDISGHRQIVQAHQLNLADAALFFRPNDHLTLFGALSEICRNPNLVRHLQEQAREIAGALSWDHAAGQLLQAYERALGPTTSARATR